MNTNEEVEALPKAIEQAAIKNIEHGMANVAINDYTTRAFLLSAIEQIKMLAGYWCLPIDKIYWLDESSPIPSTPPANEGDAVDVEWQNVHDNSDGFREFLDEKAIEYKRNEHWTLVRKNVDLYWLGRWCEEWKHKTISPIFKEDAEKK